MLPTTPTPPGGRVAPGVAEAVAGVVAPVAALAAADFRVAAQAAVGRYQQVDRLIYSISLLTFMLIFAII